MTNQAENQTPATDAPVATDAVEAKGSGPLARAVGSILHPKKKKARAKKDAGAPEASWPSPSDAKAKPKKAQAKARKQTMAEQAAAENPNIVAVDGQAKRPPKLSKDLQKKADAIIAERKGKTVPREKREKQEDLVVFAFRLTEAERDAIHAAAGPGKASQYVRALLREACAKKQ